MSGNLRHASRQPGPHLDPPTATARRLVDASVSANTRRAYAALEPISTWTL